MTDQQPQHQQHTPLNGAQLQRVQAELQRALEGIQLRKWCVELVLHTQGEAKAINPGQAVELAARIYDFIVAGRPTVAG
jgi:hypothetical protein